MIVFRMINDEILERAGGFMYDKKSNKFLISKQDLQSEKVNMHLFVINYNNGVYLQKKISIIHKKQEQIKESTKGILSD